MPTEIGRTDQAGNSGAVPGSSTDNICAYPWQQMIIDLTGEVVPCCFWAGYGNTGKPLGNTNEQTIEEIWNGKQFRELRHRNATGDLQGYPCHECMSYRWSNGQYPKFTWSADFLPESGHCYYTLIPEWFQKAVKNNPTPVILCEDDDPLPIPDALHDDIRHIGAGRYSVWGRYLYFSTSDNSNPAMNGRRYELRAAEITVTLHGLVSDSASGRNLLQAYKDYRAGEEQMAAKPSMISLISTADCNIDCPACSQNTVRLMRVQHRPETVPDVLAHVPFLYQFIWHGGEPYLIKRFREFIDNFRTKDNPNLTFGFTSNGTMLTVRELEKLDKFPRVNASISVDSFAKDTFEKIRAGASYDSVLSNVLRAMSTHDAPRRVFSVGMIICKSNMVELASNLEFAIEHEIGLNLSPILIYPVTERLDIFEDFERQTWGWPEVLDDAERLVLKSEEWGSRAIQRVNPLGMIRELKTLYARAAERYRSAITVSVRVEDPYESLRNMRNPGIIVTHLWDSDPISYLAITSHAGEYKLCLPREAAAGISPLCYGLYHDLLEPEGWLVTGPVSGHPGWGKGLTTDKKPAPIIVTVPQFTPVPRPKNQYYANYGESSPIGLQVKSPTDIYDAYRNLVQIERQAGGGAVGPRPPRSVTSTMRGALSKLNRIRHALLRMGHKHTARRG
ncbi:hypothetical protein W02_13550 [Nitrospira sp. KM1]|uniref:SPASM domain-containing protein n=1 Tax=Nitrospira sp. KM1 TaxID=1936990 RepID=UPI0013A729FE|nr:SPASM domain-containing protein [Nitrospira sp. KM1]BCA54215.1 hypothetical protein W02_13550 [Nitrospira sp. KM1]